MNENRIFLLYIRCSIDDIPLKAYATKRAAKKDAKMLFENPLILKGALQSASVVLRQDIFDPMHISLVTFKDGNLHSFEHLYEIQDDIAV